VPKDTKEDLPGTLQRSPRKAQRTYAKTLESAHEQYDDEERAHRTAFASLKHSFEKVGTIGSPRTRRAHPTRRPKDVTGSIGRLPAESMWWATPRTS
jgi:cation transport regulator ChaB